MSAPAYDQATGDIWFTDGNNGTSRVQNLPTFDGVKLRKLPT